MEFGRRYGSIRMPWKQVGHGLLKQSWADESGTCEMNILFWGTPTYAVPTLEALINAGHTILGGGDAAGSSWTWEAADSITRESRALDLDCAVFTASADSQGHGGSAATGATERRCFRGGGLWPDPSEDRAGPPAAGMLEQPWLFCRDGEVQDRFNGACWEGDPETGVSIMAMEEGLDTGQVLIEQLPIGLLDNAEQLAQKLSQLTAELMVAAMTRIEAAGPGTETDRLTRLGVTAQDAKDGTVSYARMLNKEDFMIDWKRSAPVSSPTGDGALSECLHLLASN